MNLKEIGPSEVDLFDPFDRDFVKMIRGQKKPAKIFRLIKAKVKLCSSSPEVKKHLAGIYMSKMSDNLAQGFFEKKIAMQLRRGAAAFGIEAQR